MTLYEYLSKTRDWETTVWDKDYDVETYFYKTDNKDTWDKTMNELAKLLTVLDFGKNGVTVNLSEVIEKKISKLKEADLFIKCDIDNIMNRLDSILAGHVSEEWFEKFVDVLSKKIVDFNGRKYIFRKCDTENVTQEQLQEMAEKYGKMQYEANGKKWLVIKDVGYGLEL